MPTKESEADTVLVEPEPTPVVEGVNIPPDALPGGAEVEPYTLEEPPEPKGVPVRDPVVDEWVTKSLDYFDHQVAQYVTPDEYKKVIETLVPKLTAFVADRDATELNPSPPPLDAQPGSGLPVEPEPEPPTARRSS